jgi:isopentenyldiphosphate isomerase
LKGYIGRQLRGVEISDAALPLMRRSLALMLGALTLHIGLTIWAALTQPTAVWGFVSGGLLYILFAIVALGQFFAARRGARRLTRAPSGEEMLPLVDEEGRVVGSAPRSECHKGPGKLHPVVHLHIADGKGGFYLQKRSASKEIQPGKWDCAVGGHVSAGEDLETALARELREELGVTSLALEASAAKPEPVLRYRWDTEVESELVFTFALRYAGPFAPDGDEVEEGRFWSFDEIKANIGKGVFTPNLEHELALFERAAAESRAARN